MNLLNRIKSLYCIFENKYQKDVLKKKSDFSCSSCVCVCVGGRGDETHPVHSTRAEWTESGRLLNRD